ncbi:ABC transporter G family member 1 [Medicago truncatula]|uniref:White-brown-complex ABC transporter family protein n=1 Tax=Medicago truncatula TaxID=3880 RepID=G7JCQ7_MEDTR|nr:ABC transporter G family member 1 [Medicago truncatula]AES90632.2 white-brown-complex ABC transporter family protein [Medicago truncatula]
MTSMCLPSSGCCEIKTSSESVLQRTVQDIEANTTTLEMMMKREKEDEVDGTCLTWKDIWVNTISNGKNGSKSILQGLTGYAKPGQLLAIMGPSGCGKSTLLDTLAGRLSSNTRQIGEILINGHKQELSYGTSAYVTQDDILLTTLTVREAVYYSAQLQLPNTMSKEEKKERADITIKEMGLQDAMNTRIGGWGVKGISGGQKRRVSICIEILTRPRLLFLDEPTSGLDSAASYYVMKRIASLDKKDGIQRTIITSIHQPSTEVFQLFHNLCLLSSGRTVYFGPAYAACEFFALNGFPCPPLQNPSDHLLKTINKDFDQDIETGLAGTGTIPTEEAICILVSSYKSSEMSQDVQNEVAVLSNKHTSSMDHKKKGHAGFLNQCLILIERSSMNMFRDLGYYWLRLVIYVALAISLGTVYYDLGTSYDSIKDRGSLLSFISGFLTFMTIGGFPSFVEDMKVFQRERQNGHYGVIAYVIGNTFSSIPFILLVTIIPAAITYYLPGLQKGFEHFLYFASVLFSSLMLVEGLMMIVASIVPNYLMGIITGAGIQGIMMLVGGFFKLPHEIPKPFWRYPLHYVAFHSYVFEGLFKNEYEGLRFDIKNGQGTNSYITGEEVLRDTWQSNMSYSKWVDLAILLGMIVLYRVLFLIIIKVTEKVKPIVGSLLSCMVVSPNTTIHVVEKDDATPLNGHTGGEPEGVRAEKRLEPKF